MTPWFTVGRLLFVISLAAFGIQYLLYGRFVGGLPPVPPWAPGGAMGAYFVGAFLFAAAVSIAVHWRPSLAAALVGTLFFLSVVLLHFLQFSPIISSGVARTRALEPLSLAGAAFVLASELPLQQRRSFMPDSFSGLLRRLGLLLFAFPMLIFGLQHFLYAPFIATLIPTWIPVRLFFAYFTGVAFIAAGTSMVVNVYARPAAILLGLMFLLWAVILHAPRVAASLRSGDEWSSAFVALALSGGAFMVAATFPPKPVPLGKEMLV
jgi:uncharacterized membrane protein YphA (DoxX/SURF4 family)